MNGAEENLITINRCENENRTITNQRSWLGVEYLFDSISSLTHHFVDRQMKIKDYNRDQFFINFLINFRIKFIEEDVIGNLTYSTSNNLIGRLFQPIECR